ncbi:MAG TPA: M28 family peptidase [Blastocatellia bacterium]|nr:M28 family peptidase [Blastocatellia bacterium]
MLNKPGPNRATSATILACLLLLAPAACTAQGNHEIASNPDKPVETDSARAYEHLKKLVEMGPHPSGSDSIKKTQSYLESELKSYGLTVSEDTFNGETPRGSIPMKNIIAELRGQKPDLVLITGHYDTKLQAGFVGANDGCSSAAAVLETARVLSKSKPEYTLWFVLFDGEEAVVDWGAMDGKDNTYGSRHLASKLKSDGALARVKALVLYDMIGDKNLDIKREGESTPWLIDAIWNAARALNYQKVFLDSEQYISDDHLPFRDAGVPVADLIDFNYGPGHSYWHTNLDTLDHVSGESVKIVCDVVIKALPDIFKHLDNPAAAPAKTVPH